MNRRHCSNRSGRPASRNKESPVRYRIFEGPKVPCMFPLLVTSRSGIYLRRCGKPTRFPTAPVQRAENQYGSANSKPANSNPGDTVHPDQGPVAGGFGGLPRLRRHDRLRAFARGKIGPQPDRVRRAALMGDLQGERAAGIISARPRPHRCDASASARRAPAGNRSRSTTRVLGVVAGNRETSRDNARLPGAVSVQVAQ